MGNFNRRIIARCPKLIKSQQKVIERNERFCLVSDIISLIRKDFFSERSEVYEVINERIRNRSCRVSNRLKLV